MKLSIRSKLLLFSISLCIIIMATCFSFALFALFKLENTTINQQENILNQDYDELIKVQVQAMISILSQFDKKVTNGELSLEQAKLQAADLIRNTKYGTNGYFWVDTSEGTNVVLNGTSTEGTNRINAQDANGVYFIKELLKAVQNPDGYYVNYEFPKENSTEPLPKRGFTMYFKAFDWVVGTGNYVDDIEVYLSKTKDELSKSNYESILLLLGAGIVITGLSILVSIYFSGTISKPIRKLADIAVNVSKGNLNFNFIKKPKDEVGTLIDDFTETVNVIKSLMDDLYELDYQQNQLGDIDFFINENKYLGVYRDVANSVNKTVLEHITVEKNSFNCINEIVNGNFDAPMEKLPGKKSFINEAIEGIRSSITLINDEVVSLTKSTVAGDLSKKIDVSKFRGDWAVLMSDLNEVLSAVANPMGEMTSVLVEISKGNLSKRVEGNYNGVFATVKDSLNTTASVISSYLDEIIRILADMAEGNLTGKIDRSYLGDFQCIKESINSINDSLNHTLKDIAVVSEQVLDGAEQISLSSTYLAEGATEQANSIQELSSSVEIIDDQIKHNAANSIVADTLSAKSVENAQKGNDAMIHMLNSMNGIKESSANISKIIKVIEDIAFQTNILALNAAVEAARAGVHGKGFSIVAEEVRNLAIRSQNAVNETTQLIEDSIVKVNEGTKIADETAENLTVIVENAFEVSKIVKSIATASSNQAQAISQISDGLNQISSVVQNNSSSSEESAAASLELSSQALLLKDKIAFFKLAK